MGDSCKSLLSIHICYSSACKGKSLAESRHSQQTHLDFQSIGMSSKHLTNTIDSNRM